MEGVEGYTITMEGSWNVLAHGGMGTQVTPHHNRGTDPNYSKGSLPHHDRGTLPTMAGTPSPLMAGAPFPP